MTALLEKVASSSGWRHLVRGGLVGLVSLIWAVMPAAAQDKVHEIDGLFSWATPDAPGCVVAVSKHGKLVVHRAYGSADLERDVPLSTSSVFDVGSVRKQFIAAAVLVLAHEEKLALSDDIRSHLKELPDSGHKITVDHLLTHTGGVRDWTGIARLSAKNEDALSMIRRQRSINFAPGEEWSYSNSGYVLLTELVARVSGMSFAKFAQARLFAPLGMQSTRYVDDMRSVVKNRALAYEKKGAGWKLAMLLDNDRGGQGALLGTAGDLITWSEALMSGRLGEFVTEKLHEPATLNNGRKLRYARGLALDTNRGGRVVWHSGSAAGYKSLIGRYPEQELSIAILCNGKGGPDGRKFVRRIYDLFVPAADAPDADAPDADAPDAGANAPVAGAKAKETDLKGKAGLFLGEGTGEPLRLLARGGRLRIAGGPPLVCVAKDRFRILEPTLRFRSQDDCELHFPSADELELKSMEGKTTRYCRAERYVATPADLKALEARYESDEIGAIFSVATGRGGLIVHLEHAPDTSLRFRAISRDLFQRGPLTIRCRRNQSGAVTALALTNPILRDVEFTRLVDRR